jgi:hypothetical protein
MCCYCKYVQYTSLILACAQDRVDGEHMFTIQ